MTVFLSRTAGKKYGVLRFCLNRHSFDKAMLAQGCCFGVPPMLQSGIGSAGSLLLQNFMNGFGTQTVAAVTTAYRVDSIVMVPLINLGSGFPRLWHSATARGGCIVQKRSFAVGTALWRPSLLLTVLVIPAGGRLIAMFGAGGSHRNRRPVFPQNCRLLSDLWPGHCDSRPFEGAGDILYTSLAGIAALASRIIASYLLVPLLPIWSSLMRKVFHGSSYCCFMRSVCSGGNGASKKAGHMPVSDCAAKRGLDEPHSLEAPLSCLARPLAIRPGSLRWLPVVGAAWKQYRAAVRPLVPGRNMAPLRWGNETRKSGVSLFRVL